MVGRLFLAFAGESNMKQVWLECGGKSPNLVFADADLDVAVEGRPGIYSSAGEICSANSGFWSRPIRRRDAVLAGILERAAAITAWRPAGPGDDGWDLWSTSQHAGPAS